MAFLLDGSSTITPDTPALQMAFGQFKGQKKGCGFSVPKWLDLFDVFTFGSPVRQKTCAFFEFESLDALTVVND